jgi:ABC-type proline/glycine betaine transport system ATPase subunit
VTTIYVTHDQTEAMTMGGQGGGDEGRDPPGGRRPPHLYDHPANIFVAREVAVGIRSEDMEDARLAPRSRVWAGDQVEVVVDTERMHFFDPETGNTIRD